MTEAERVPRRFRFPTVGGETPTGVKSAWNYGCYFPATDLIVCDMGHRGTGEPTWEDLEWIDPKAGSTVLRGATDADGSGQV